MFKRFTSSTPPTAAAAAAQQMRGKVPSVISAGMNLLGNVIGDGIIDIDGRIEGNVRCHTVLVRADGHIRGDVTADTVMIHGHVQGLIKARTVLLYATAEVTGTIMHESLTIEDGASVDGKLKRTESVFAQEENTPALGFIPSLDASFMNDNDEPQSEEEIKVLENLRLIS
jgi:cytoskeletal protein CcmA (bactofilin family)